MKVPKWVWLIIAAGGAWYLYSKYKSTTIALTSASVSNAPQNALPGTPAAISSAGQQIGQGLTTLFNQV